MIFTWMFILHILLQHVVLKKKKQTSFICSGESGESCWFLWSKYNKCEAMWAGLSPESQTVNTPDLMKCSMSPTSLLVCVFRCVTGVVVTVCVSSPTTEAPEVSRFILALATSPLTSRKLWNVSCDLWPLTDVTLPPSALTPPSAPPEAAEGGCTLVSVFCTNHSIYQSINSYLYSAKWHSKPYPSIYQSINLFSYPASGSSLLNNGEVSDSSLPLSRSLVLSLDTECVWQRELFHSWGFLADLPNKQTCVLRTSLESIYFLSQMKRRLNGHISTKWCKVAFGELVASVLN